MTGVRWPEGRPDELPVRATLFRECCRALFSPVGGDGGARTWARAAAEFLGVAERNVYYWAAGTKYAPDGVLSELDKEIKRRLRDPQDQTPGLAAMKMVLGGTAPSS